MADKKDNQNSGQMSMFDINEFCARFCRRRLDRRFFSSGRRRNLSLGNDKSLVGYNQYLVTSLAMEMSNQIELQRLLFLSVLREQASGSVLGERR